MIEDKVQCQSLNIHVKHLCAFDLSKGHNVLTTHFAGYKRGPPCSTKIVNFEFDQRYTTRYCVNVYLFNTVIVLCSCCVHDIHDIIGCNGDYQANETSKNKRMKLFFTRHPLENIN